MIVDHISNCEMYYVFGERFKKAFEFLKANDIRKMELGRHDIDGDDVFILVQEYTSKTIDNCGLEAHKVYADVHYVAEGFEYLGYPTSPAATRPFRTIRLPMPHSTRRSASTCCFRKMTSPSCSLRMSTCRRSVHWSAFLCGRLASRSK